MSGSYLKLCHDSGMMMVARRPTAACAELIDFEQARIQRSMSSRQGELPALSAGVAPLPEESDTPVGDMLAHAPPHAAENRSLAPTAGCDDPWRGFCCRISSRN
jgi:hypothetical protein